jgi:hypothetical protein
MGHLIDIHDGIRTSNNKGGNDGHYFIVYRG